jgi:hypothetical protein
MIPILLNYEMGREKEIDSASTYHVASVGRQKNIRGIVLEFSSYPFICGVTCVII